MLWLRTAAAQRARKSQVAVAIAVQSVNTKEASNANCLNERCKILRSFNRVFVFEIVLCIGAPSKDPARFVDLRFWILRNKEAQEYKSSSQETKHNSISVIAECSKDLRGKSSWVLLVWEAGGLDSARIRRICQVVVDRALVKMPDLQSRIEHRGNSSTVSPPCGVEPNEPKAKSARVDGGPYRCTFATANVFKEFIRTGSLPVQGAGLRQQFDVRDPSFCWTTLSKFVVWGGNWQMKRSVPVQKARAEVEEMLGKGNLTQWLLSPEKVVPYLPLALVDSDQCTPPFTFCRPDSKGRLSSF